MGTYFVQTNTACIRNVTASNTANISSLVKNQLHRDANQITSRMTRSQLNWKLEYLVILNMLFIILSGFSNTNFCNMQENKKN